MRRGASTGVGGATAAIGMYTFPLSHAHPPPSMLHVAYCMSMLVLQCQVRCETAAQPGSFSRAKSACHESWRGCGPRARPRWSLLGYGCASLAAVVRLCPSQATKMLACEHLSAVFLWCLVACEMRVAVSQNVAVVGWGPAVNPLCQCVSNVRPSCESPCLALGAALRRLLNI